MQKADIHAAAQLLEMASDGSNDEEWQAKFHRHVEYVQIQYSTTLTAGGSSKHRSQYIRAQLELHEIVWNRILARVQLADRGAAQALEALNEVNLPLIQEALGRCPTSPSSPSSPGRSRTPPKTEKSTIPTHGTTNGTAGGGGASAFAAAVARERALTMKLPKSPRSPKSAYSEEEAIMNLGYAKMTMGTNAARSCSTPNRNLDSPGDKSSLPSPRLPRRYAEIHARGCHPTAALNGAKISTSRLGKGLSLRQLRDVMNTLYESKAQHDVRCTELKEPSETMEQHLYGFLSRRFGARSVVQEWAQSIYRAIDQWGEVECDVAVFGKILQNTVSEGFSAVQDTLRASVAMLLKKYVQARNPSRPQSELDALWRVRLQRGVPYAECERVVKYMYNERDSEEVLQRVAKASEEWSNAPQAEPESVRYRDLVQILLRFQMELTESYLADFVKAFREVDEDHDGIVNQQDMQVLVHKLSTDINLRSRSQGVCQLNEARVQVLAAISPYQRATFSECVDIFTEMISARWACLREPQHNEGDEITSLSSVVD